MSVEQDSSSEEGLNSEVLKFSGFVSRWLLRKPAFWGSIISSIALLALMSITIISVIARYTPFKGGRFVSGYHELSMLLFAILVASSVAYCWYMGRHIRIEVVLERTSAKGKVLLDILSVTMAIAFLASVETL